jgi:ring-1,2-phenylacetyl-CoA epoxidase subunit PaaC
MASNLKAETQEALFSYLLRLGDDRLILSHRLCEWCGHGPILEEDIALSNLALDNIGQAEALLQLAGEVEGKGRSEDDLAYKRGWQDFQCCQLVQRPRGDFGFTIMRQFLFDAYCVPLWEELSNSKHELLAGIAQKSLKEAKYHLRHSGEWVLRLGDGTEESHKRVQSALNELWRYTGELFEADEVDECLHAEGLIPDIANIRKRWEETVFPLLEQATLTYPGDDTVMVSGTRNGAHSEYLGHILTEMQVLPRAYPDANWQ